MIKPKEVNNPDFNLFFNNKFKKNQDANVMVNTSNNENAASRKITSLRLEDIISSIGNIAKRIG